MDRADIAREPSRPLRYAVIFISGRTGFDYDDGALFDDCAGPAELMVPPPDGFGRQPGVAFRLRNGSHVVVRPRVSRPAYLGAD